MPRRKGYKCSDETKRKMSLIMFGRTSPMKGRKISKETRLKYSLVKIGNKNPNWKGGISKDKNKLIRNAIQCRLWREAVFARDAWTCKECGKKSGQGKTVYLEAHHIKSFSKYPELRFAIDNGITLCKECHKKTDNYGGKGEKRK